MMKLSMSKKNMMNVGLVKERVEKAISGGGSSEMWKAHSCF